MKFGNAERSQNADKQTSRFSALGKTFALVIVAFTAACAGKDHFSLLWLFAQGLVLYRDTIKD